MLFGMSPELAMMAANCIFFNCSVGQGGSRKKRPCDERRAPCGTFVFIPMYCYTLFFDAGCLTCPRCVVYIYIYVCQDNIRKELKIRTGSWAGARGEAGQGMQFFVYLQIYLYI